MANWTVSPLGQSNGAGGVQALFDDVFVNVVRTTFEAQTQFLKLTRTKTITNGHGATFPHLGDIAAKFHIPGEEIDANTINHAETFIPADQLIVAPVAMSNMDQWMSNRDYRGDYAGRIGTSLAQVMDKHLGYAFTLGARQASSDLTERDGGESGLTNANLAHASAATDAGELMTLIANSVQILDEKNVPKEGRFTLLRPAQFHLLLRAGLVEMDRDFGGMGSAAMAQLPYILGTNVIVSNNIPTNAPAATAGPVAGTAGVTAGGDALANTTQTGGNSYNGDYSKTVALVGQQEAMGTVVLKDVDMESEYSVTRQATILMGRYAMGHKVLRPECLCEITTT